MSFPVSTFAVIRHVVTCSLIFSFSLCSAQRSNGDSGIVFHDGFTISESIGELDQSAPSRQSGLLSTNYERIAPSGGIVRLENDPGDSSSDGHLTLRIESGKSAPMQIAAIPEADFGTQVSGRQWRVKLQLQLEREGFANDTWFGLAFSSYAEAEAPGAAVNAFGWIHRQNGATLAFSDAPMEPGAFAGYIPGDSTEVILEVDERSTPARLTVRARTRGGAWQTLHESLPVTFYGNGRYLGLWLHQADNADAPEGAYWNAEIDSISIETIY